jgi:hypothetical protein
MTEPDSFQDNANGLVAFGALGQFLQEDGWYPQQLEDRYVYRMGFAGENGNTTCYAQVVVDLEILVFYAVAPVKVPEAALPAAAEFLTRANYGLRIGNFEMDYSDGEVRYKSSLDFEGTTLEPALIRNAIYPAARTMDRYLAGLMAVIYGGKEPLEAIEEIEGGGSQ